MIRRLYDWTMALAARPTATRWLAAVSFIESSIFPIPPDVMLAPMCLARRDRALWYAAVCTIASVLGGLAGYAIGFFLFDTVGQAILEFYGYGEKFATFRDEFNRMGWALVLIAGFTPFPFKVITIASGVTGLSLITFVLAAIISRAGRFFLVAGLFYFFGAPVKAFIEKRLEWVTVAFTVLLIGGFLAVKLL
jgi:membrane protein YqaA with SNARE-associated domain